MTALLLTVTAGVLHNTVAIIKLTLKSSVRLITHLLRAAALGVMSLRLNSCALEFGQLPIANWDSPLRLWLRVWFLKKTITLVASLVRLLNQRLGVGPLKETLISAVSWYKHTSQRLAGFSSSQLPSSAGKT